MRNHLQTQRLNLRWPQLSDAKAIAENLGDYDVAKMTGSIPYPYFELSAEFWILQARAKWYSNAGFAYIITDKAGTLLGCMDLFVNENGDMEIGYWIGKPYWGQGYASEAAAAVVSEAFDTLEIEHIDASHYKDNPASGRVLEKLGFAVHNKDKSLYSLSRTASAPGVELRLLKNHVRQGAVVDLASA